MRRQYIECDRCHDEVWSPADATKMGVDVPVLVDNRPVRNFDLCEKCAIDLGKFVRNEQVRCAGPMSSNM